MIAPKPKLFRESFIFIIIGILCVVSWYFYKPQIVGFWNSGVESSEELSANSWNRIVSFWNSSVDRLAEFSFPSFGLEKIFNTEKGVARIIKDCASAVS